MKVRKIMTTKVVTVGVEDSLHKVYEIFQQHRFHHLLVVQGKTLLGVISDRDLLKSMGPRIGNPTADLRDHAAFKKKVFQIMSRQLITINQEESVLQAVRVFNRYPVSCLPVVDDKQEWVGILSWRDVFKQIEKLKSGQTLLIPQDVTKI
ncbi:CBS domain-containing protein [Bowmanella dokdonensis]|uniref:CBS domain-containing protein n=1 Tax=Bowmanella dokdonensis TaxID=751969 RepID=A0A939DNM8_9ALTE|nr:CBS domain-containing protein [Bowmanella dokdonensis]